MNRIRQQLQRLSIQSTRVIAIRFGQSFPFWYVSEYPKAGGTWLSKMLADYLGLPFPQYYLFPPCFECLIQNHWGFHRRLRRVFYIYRDGRDTMVSLYFYRLRRAHPDAGREYRPALKKELSALLGRNFDANDSARNLPRFIEWEMRYPKSTRLNWAQHVASWCESDRDGVTYLSYENLLSNTYCTLETAIEAVTEKKIDPKRLQDTISRYTFKQMSGRQHGEEDRASFIRKGVSGDWVNHFSREAAEIFNDFAGDALVNLGYEKDKAWIDRHEFLRPKL